MNLYIFLFSLLLFIFNDTIAYQTRLITELCPPGDSLMGGFNRLLKHMREIQLGENDQSAALIQYSWNSSNFKKYDDCRFRVTATNDVTHKNRGVFVSIRRLNLRKSPEKNGECIDYIRLKFAEEKSPKFCGKLNASVDDVQKIYFGESGGMIEVHLHLDKFRPLKNIDDTLDIELVFTANQDCGTDNYIRCYDNTCISNAFENDGINNCPPPYCIDESGRCPPPIVVTSKEPTNNTDIVISALTSLIFTLVGVGSCLWLCWHIKDCFLPETDTQTNGGRSTATTNNTSRRINNTRSTAFNTPGDNDTSASASNYRPTAPTGDDKDDNPPPYDELFPHLAKTNNDTNK